MSIGPKPSSARTEALLINRLDELIDLKDPLVPLARLINWSEIERTFAVSFTSGRGRPRVVPAPSRRLALPAAHL